MKKVLFTSSAGGHLCELLQLSPMFSDYDSYLVTEKEATTLTLEKDLRMTVFYLNPLRKTFVVVLALKVIINAIISLKYLSMIHPNIIISTGASVSVPLCILGRFYGAKIIFIETFAASSKPTLSGKIMYRFADVFITQWEVMLKYYPKAKYIGGVF